MIDVWYHVIAHNHVMYTHDSYEEAMQQCKSLTAEQPEGRDYAFLERVKQVDDGDEVITTVSIHKVIWVVGKTWAVQHIN